MSKAFVACLIVFGACALLAPSAALAAGPSAGDQQYIDPLAGSGHHGSSGSHHGSTTPAAPAPTSPTSSGATSTSSPASTSAASPASTSVTTTTSSSPKGHDPSAGLPRTGFDALLVALIGALLLGAGALLALVARRA